jgi:hypothetical protein
VRGLLGTGLWAAGQKEHHVSLLARFRPAVQRPAAHATISKAAVVLSNWDAVATALTAALPARQLIAILARLFRRARSSAVEHHLDMVVVTGSIPVARTNFVLLHFFLFMGEEKVGSGVLGSILVLHRHPCAGRGPCGRPGWIPAYAGMTNRAESESPERRVSVRGEQRLVKHGRRTASLFFLY